MSENKSQIKYQIKRILQKYQVAKQPCQVSFCNNDATPSLIEENSKIKTTHIHFFCKSHHYKYIQLKSGNISEIKKLDPVFEEISNADPISIKELIASGSPLEVSTQALRQRLYKYLDKQGITERNFICAVPSCMDKALLYIPNFESPFKVQPLCHYHHNTEKDTEKDTEKHLLNLKDESDLEFLRTLYKKYKELFSNFENTPKNTINEQQSNTNEKETKNQNTQTQCTTPSKSNHKPLSKEDFCLTEKGKIDPVDLKITNRHAHELIHITEDDLDFSSYDEIEKEQFLKIFHERKQMKEIEIEKNKN